MAWQRDLVAVLRGLDKISRAVAQHQQSEVARQWKNSTVRTAVQGGASKLEEKVSDALLKQSITKVSYVKF